MRRAHSDAEVRDWVASHVIPELETWVATIDGRLVAMMALSPGWIDQLYVAPAVQGRGVGSVLVDVAKQRQPSGLQLWTFQVNERARRFYARHGFAEVELTDGAANEEREPDVRLEWRPRTVGGSPR